MSIDNFEKPKNCDIVFSNSQKMASKASNSKGSYHSSHIISGFSKPSITKGQASLEYIIIFGISFTILVIMGGLFLGYFNTEKKSLDNQYLENLGLEIMSNVEKIYFLGNGNRFTIDVKFPEGIENISIRHMNNFVLTDGNITSFDYLNITYIANGEHISNRFEANEFYIRFNCSEGCYHDNTRNVSWYNDSDISPGFKRIRFESKGDYVAIDFPKD